MTASTITTTDLYRPAGRITRATVGNEVAPVSVGSEVYVFEFEDGRWLEVIGGSPGWPMDELDQEDTR